MYKRIGRSVFTFFAAIALVIASVPVMYSQTALAQTRQACGDTEFYSSNDILFYNPCATVCSATGGGDIKVVNSLEGKNNGEKIFNFWVAAGFTAQQAAGITGSMKHEGGFSAFRQEEDKEWEDGGWGIAQFTHSPGERANVKAYLKEKLGSELFNQYYKEDYGGPVLESDGFIPEGITEAINDKFLLGELNYLLEHIHSLIPNEIRRDAYRDDFGQLIDGETTLYSYLKTLVRAEDSAKAWTYLYEYPGDIKTTAEARALTAMDIMTLYSEGISTTCGGGLVAGGMTLEQAIEFMNEYNSSPDSVNYIGGAGRDCNGGPLSNCVSFSVYFINKYTNIQGFVSGAPGNGSTVVPNVIARNPTIGNGHSPQPYAIFSTPSGSMWCGDVKCGHTGVILGVDIDRQKVIVGEAGCGAAASWDTAREYPLSTFDSDSYIYAYTDGLLKEGI